MYCRECLYNNSDLRKNFTDISHPFGNISGLEGNLKGYMNQKRKQFDAAAKMKDHLEEMQKMGAELFVDGEKLSPQDTAAMVVCEENHYMADYVLGKDGNVEQIRFDWVNL